MAFKLADRVKQTATTTGTGAFTLSTIPTGFRAFSAVLSVSDTTYYTIAHQSLDEWEVGYGTYSSANTLTRTKVIASTNANAAVNFSAGNKDVFITLPAVGAFTNNVVLGSNIGYDQSLRQSSVIFGTGISSGGTGTSVVIGASANNAANNNVVVGSSATGSGSNGNLVVIGANASASGVSSYSTVVGASADTAGDNSTAVGYGATAGASSVAIGDNSDAGAFITGSIAIGSSAAALYDYSTVIGYNTFGGSGGYDIRFGASQGSSGGGQNIWIGNTVSQPVGPTSMSNSIAIGHGITVLASSATYMNQFRTGVTPAGPAYNLKWDTVTNEVYADAPASAANWYTYQDNGATLTNINLATPSGIAATSNPGSEAWVVLNTSLFITGWSFGGTYGAFYSNSPSSYPVATPISGAMYTGMATCYYAGYTTDSGTTNTSQVYTGSSTYSTSGSSFSVGGFPLFGATQYGHAVLTSIGNNIGGFTPSSGVTLVEEKYDSLNDYTYFFVDMDSSAMSSISGGGNIGTQSAFSATIYIAIWYNY